MTDKAHIATKVRALLAKTVDNGCTEAEAMAAAIKAKALIDEYQINLSELELAEEGFVKGKAEAAWTRRFNVQDYLMVQVASFCEVKTWRQYDNYGFRAKGPRVIFFGLKSDVEFANWLLVALESFIWTQADAFELGERMRLGPSVGGYYMKRNFARGAVFRIKERLREAVAARKPQAMGDGRSLVIVKQALVTREFDKLGLKFSNSSGGELNRGDAPADAYSAGKAAGDKASFGRPVGSQAERLKIAN